MRLVRIFLLEQKVLEVVCKQDILINNTCFYSRLYVMRDLKLSSYKESYHICLVKLFAMVSRPLIRCFTQLAEISSYGVFFSRRNSINPQFPCHKSKKLLVGWIFHPPRLFKPIHSREGLKIWIGKV